MRKRGLRDFFMACAAIGYMLTNLAMAACLEEGGNERCEKPTPTEWVYGLCDEAGASIMRARAWCEAQGGTWVPGPDCVGDEPVTEDKIVSFSKAFAEILHSATCTVTEDSGWGITSDSSQCHKGAPEYKNGLLVRDNRKLFISCVKSDGSPREETVWALRTRSLQCPEDSTGSRYDADGNLYCIVPEDHTPTTCNPVKVGSGSKLYFSTDYTSQQGLTLNRHFRSSGIQVPYSASALPAMPMGRKWWMESMRRLYIVNGSSRILAIQADSSGELIYYDQTGQSVPRYDLYKTSRGIVSGDMVYVNNGTRIDAYDMNGVLRGEGDLQGKRRIYHYSDGFPIQGIDETGEAAIVTLPAGTLMVIESDAGVRIQFGYDDKLFLRSARLPDGLKLLYHYDLIGNLDQVTFADGATERYHYEYATRPALLTGVTDALGTRYTTYEYEYRGLTTRTSMVGDVQTHQYAYLSRSTTVTDPLGTARTYSWQKSAEGIWPLGQSQPEGAGCGPASQSFAYGVNSNPTRTTGFDGAVTTYTYDNTRNLEIQRVEASGMPEARTISTQWHPHWPLKAIQAQPRLITGWVYNGQPNPLTGEILTCAPANAVLVNNLPIAVVCAYVELPTSDATGQAGFAATPDGEPRIWRYTYDARGNVLSEDGPRTDVNDVTTYTYWALDAQCPGASDGTGMDKGCRGQLRARTNALGHVVEFLKYNAHGQLLHRRDPDGMNTYYTYDNRQRLTSITQGSQSIAYTYDARGLLVGSTQTGGPALTYEYDPAHRLVAVRDNQGNRIDYTLDTAGNRTSERYTDPLGQLRQSVTYQYDALGRIEREQRGM